MCIFVLTNPNLAQSLKKICATVQSHGCTFYKLCLVVNSDKNFWSFCWKLEVICFFLFKRIWTKYWKSKKKMFQIKSVFMHFLVWALSSFENYFKSRLNLKLYIISLKLFYHSISVRGFNFFAFLTGKVISICYFSNTNNFLEIFFSDFCPFLIFLKKS